MTPQEFYDEIMFPALADLPPTLNAVEARLFMLAVAGQESSWRYRIQLPHGPARSFWQIEAGGMLRGVLNGAHRTTLERYILTRYSIPNVDSVLFEALAWHDPLAYAVARLGLFMDPHRLPMIADEDDAWDTYLRVWRPGSPSRARWATVYPQALAVVVP